MREFVELGLLSQVEKRHRELRLENKVAAELQRCPVLGRTVGKTKWWVPVCYHGGKCTKQLELFSFYYIKFHSRPDSRCASDLKTFFKIVPLLVLTMLQMWQNYAVIFFVIPYVRQAWLMWRFQFNSRLSRSCFHKEFVWLCAYVNEWKPKVMILDLSSDRCKNSSEMERDRCVNLNRLVELPSDWKLTTTRSGGWNLTITIIIIMSFWHFQHGRSRADWYEAFHRRIVIFPRFREKPNSRSLPDFWSISRDNTSPKNAYGRSYHAFTPFLKHLAHWPLLVSRLAPRSPSSSLCIFEFLYALVCSFFRLPSCRQANSVGVLVFPPPFPCNTRAVFKNLHYFLS